MLLPADFADPGAVLDWREFTERLAGNPRRPLPYGIAFPNDIAPEPLYRFLDGLKLIVLPFPHFTDGRSFSLAAMIRPRFHGELRAKGYVLPDQAGFLYECGFDSISPDRAIPREIWRNSARSISGSYQSSFGTRDFILRARHSRHQSGEVGVPAGALARAHKARFDNPASANLLNA